MGFLLDDLRCFDIDAIQCSTAAQDEGKSLKTVKHEEEHIMAKWTATENIRAALRHAIVCPNVTGRAKHRMAQSKSHRAGSLVMVE